MGSDAKLEFENIFHNGSTGKLKIAEMGLGWKDAETGSIVTVPAKDMAAVAWLRVARGYRLEIKLKASGKAPFCLDNFSRNDHEELVRIMKQYFALDLSARELSLRGWNWGRTEFNGSDMAFVVGNNTPAFQLPLKEVASTSLSNKTEVSLEFNQPQTPADAAQRKRMGDTLVEIRFHVPGMATKDQLGDPETPPKDGEEGEINQEHVLDDDGNPLTAAALFHTTVRERGEVGAIQGEAIVAFQDMLCLTPRGRFEIDLFDEFFRLRGKSHDYKLAFSAITKMFLLPKPDGQFWMFILGLEPPLRQGQTRYPYLVFQFARDEEIECDLVLDEEQVKKYDKLEKSYDAPTYQVISDVFTGLTDKRVIKSKFRSSQGSQALKCSLKANEALLYPLERQLLSVPKPPSLLLHREIVRVTFSRVGGAGGGRTFEVKFSMDTGVEHTYSSIPREEFVYLESYCRDAGLEVENEMEAESATRAGFGDAMMDDDLSDDESEGRGKRAHRDINFAGVGGDDEDEGSSVDEDFMAEKKDDSDVSSTASSDVSDEDKGDRSDISDIKEVGDAASGSGENEDDDDIVMDDMPAPKPKKSSSSSKKKGGEEEGGGKAKKVKKDPNAPKRGLSAYMFFVKEKRADVSASNASMSFGEVGKELGRLWKEVSAEDKEKYDNMAAADKERYKREMENQYTPPEGIVFKKGKKSPPPPAGKKTSGKKEDASSSSKPMLSVEFVESSDDE
ncbi:MAG: hypothetical protein SGCHY_002277 [Lobulomycetales sp.]